MSARQRLSTIARPVAASAIVLLSAACGGVPGDYGIGPTGTTTTGVGGGAGGPTSDAGALTGRWTRIVYFDAGGAARSSQTTFAFDGAGGFTRVVVATNLADGIADAVTDVGSYVSTATTVTLAFRTPGVGSSTFGYRVQAGTATSVATLLLDGTAYTRLAAGAFP